MFPLLKASLVTLVREKEGRKAASPIRHVCGLTERLGLGDRILTRDPALCFVSGGAEAIDFASVGILHKMGQTKLGGE